MAKIGFIGAGQMATALAGGIVKATNHQLVIADPSEDAIKTFCAVVGDGVVVDVKDANVDVVESADVTFLAMKPQYFDAAIVRDAFSKFSNRTDDAGLLVSIVAGIPIEKIVERTGINRVVRTMPNTPCLIGQGAIGMACAAAVTDDDRNLAMALLQTTGLVVEIEEDLLDAVTGLSGSGPGYVFELIEAMTLGGEKQQLPREVAQSLAIKTVLGAAMLALETGVEPETLRDRVTSPNGTTLAGLNRLKQGGFRDLIANTIESATVRSKELRG